MITIRIFETPVRIKPTVLPLLLLGWAGVTWLGIYWHPRRSVWQGLLIGFLSFLLLMFADFGHALAHIFSARYAKAPMDEILIAGDMPRTIYLDNDVAPRTHWMRALGGPIFSASFLLLSLGFFAIAPQSSILRELTAWSTAGHAFIFLGSLLPLPIVDGGAILKWLLVERGKTEREAEATIKRVNLAMVLLAVITGIILVVMRMWIAGAAFIVASGVIFSVATGKIK
jgi:hypothetical protein